MNNNELYHHGILGMKWGVRRTPEQLGYKTSTNKRKPKTERERKAAAKEAIKKAKLKQKTDLKLAEIQRKGQEKIERTAAKEIAKQQAKLDKQNRKNQAKQQAKINKQRQAELKKKQARLNDPMAKLTNEELREKYERLLLEKNVYDMNNQLSKYKPTKKGSLTKRFAQTVFNDVIKPAAVTAGKDLAINYMKKIGADTLGLKQAVSEYDKIAREATKLRNLKNIAIDTDYSNKRANDQKKEAVSAESQRKKNSEKSANEKATERAKSQNPFKDQMNFNEKFTDEYGPASDYNTSSDSYTKTYSNEIQNGLSTVKSWDPKYSEYVYEVPFTDVSDRYSSSGEEVVRRLLGG